jgi:hypothetical protein
MEKLNKYAENPNYREKKDTGQNLPMERLGGIETFE